MNDQIRKALEEQEDAILIRHNQAMQKMRDQISKVEQRQRLAMQVVIVSVLGIVVVISRCGA